MRVTILIDANVGLDWEMSDELEELLLDHIPMFEYQVIFSGEWDEDVEDERG